MTPPVSGSLLLLDTTILIDVLRNRNRRRAWLEQLVLSGKVLATSVICIAEVYGGLRPGEEAATRRHLANLEWLPVSAPIAEQAGLIKARLGRQGRTHSVTDMIIAATAIECGCALATDNQRRFQIPGLTLVALP
jgi:predicted nucleic acid-binding protein